MNILPVSPAHLLADTAPERRWMISDLWSYEAVGIIGGEPKCGKSVLALSIAVAVASGKPCLGQFDVSHQGRVLLFAAEDPLNVVKNRIAAIALSYAAALSALDILVITRPSLRLDLDADYELLKNTVERFSPRLLILDPFVRLHRVDENAAGEIAPLLSRLRHLQRTFHLSVIVVHHARKDSKNTRAGQALRGSSEFHAWGDSNLYLRRKPSDALSLTIEHRAEQAHPVLELELASNELGPFHRIIQRPPPSSPSPLLSPKEKIVRLLASSQIPLPLKEIRASTQLRNQVAADLLRQLIADGSVSHSSSGYTTTVDK